MKVLVTPKTKNFKKIVCITAMLTIGLCTVTMAKGPFHFFYRMDANSNKVFEWRDFNVLDEKENTYSTEIEDELTIKIISSDFTNNKSRRNLYRLVRFEIITPDLWRPQNFEGTILSQNEQKVEQIKITVRVYLSKGRLLFYGLVILLVSMALFGSVYYIFNK